MSSITFSQAKAIADATLAKGQELSLKPLTVAVLDAGGHLIVLMRQDGASIMRPQIAIGKASGALALGCSSRQIGVMAVERPTFIASLSSISAAGIVPAAGGLLVLGEDKQVLGAVGVTGDTSDNDETCALAGIDAAGLQPQAAA